MKQILSGLIIIIILAIIGILIGMNIGYNPGTGLESLGISFYEVLVYLGALIGFVIFVLILIFIDKKHSDKE